MMRLKQLKPAFLFLALAATVVACYPGGPEYIEDFDFTYTHNYNNDFDWADKTKNVYVMPDTVMELSDPTNSPKPLGNQDEILKKVADNLANYGFVRELDTAQVKNSDFVVIVSNVRSNNYYYTWWGGGWDYWGGWGWGGCCYYPPVTTVGNYRTGSLIVEIINVDELNQNEETIPIIWQGVGEGLFEGSAQNIKSRTLKSIDQMFKQSPYLNRN